MRRFVLLDRDGTIIVEKHYLKSLSDLELLPNSVTGLRKLAAQGYGLIVITNQSGVGRGLVTSDEVEAIHQALITRLARQGVELAAVYYCPHAPASNCPCRKPKTQLAEQAARDFHFDLTQSLVIGDKASDIQFGRAIGARTVLVRTGYGRQQEEAAKPDRAIDDLGDI